MPQGPRQRTEHRTAAPPPLGSTQCECHGRTSTHPRPGDERRSGQSSTGGERDAQERQVDSGFRGIARLSSARVALDEPVPAEIIGEVVAGQASVPGQPPTEAVNGIDRRRVTHRQARRRGSAHAEADALAARGRDEPTAVEQCGHLPVGAPGWGLHHDRCAVGPQGPPGRGRLGMRSNPLHSTAGRRVGDLDPRRVSDPIQVRLAAHLVPGRLRNAQLVAQAREGDLGLHLLESRRLGDGEPAGGVWKMLPAGGQQPRLLVRGQQRPVPARGQ